MDRCVSPGPHTSSGFGTHEASGRPNQATPYNIDSGPRAAEAIEGRGDYPKQCPLGLACMLTACPFWALREIEASNAFWRDVIFRARNGLLAAPRQQD